MSSSPLLRLGLPSAARALGAATLVSANALARYDDDRYFRGFRTSCPDLDGMDVALDSAGFVAWAHYGDFPWTVEQYVALAASRPWAWWASMDACCEPEVAGSGRSGPWTAGRRRSLRLGCARVQVNGWVPSPGLVGLSLEFFDLEIVLQTRDENGLAEAARHAAAIRRGGGRASVLWDPSGGTGVRGRLDVVADGYAGGISPDNVGEVLEELAAAGRRCWIDMESGVRTGDAFDLRKVRAVLEAAAPFVVEG